MKSRYLQLSDVMMFEYQMLEGNDVCNIPNPGEYLVCALKDNHKAMLSPESFEVDSSVAGGSTYKKRLDPISLNTLNHFAIPKDKEDSMWYTFLDPDYKYDTPDNIDVPDEASGDIKIVEYCKFLEKDSSTDSSYFKSFSGGGVRWDTMKLYFVNGYDFSNIYGFLTRISVDSNVDGKMIDLCDFFFTKSTAYKLVKFLPNPIIFGNNIYDRYIEINLPCLWDLRNGNGGSLSDMINYLDIKTAHNNLKLNFAYVLSEDKEINEIETSLSEMISGVTYKNVNCTFTKSSSLRGVVPTDTINSDNLGCYIAEMPDLPYFEFYGTWNDEPLTYQIVDKFNKGIVLYDNSLIRQNSAYEVDEDYQAGYNVRKWIVVHEVKCSLCIDSSVVKEENYSMTQAFINTTDPYKFHYRPMIFDEMVGLLVDNINIVYTMRLINTEDKVQFVKVASLAVCDDVSKYYAKGTSLKAGDMTPFCVYNKIVENKHENVGTGGGIGNTKFVKIFYDSTSIILDDDGTVRNGNYEYTLRMSQAPKTYKFVFKKMSTDGKYTYMDLTNGYYRLMFRDSSGKVVTIDPTYSSNMNMYLGEIEFTVNSGVIQRLLEVDDTERKMSIVAYSDDNHISSMFDFLYEI